MSRKKKGRSRAARRRQRASKVSVQENIPLLEEPKEKTSCSVTEGIDNSLQKEAEEIEEVLRYYKQKKPYTGEVRRGDIFFFDKNVLDVGVEQHGGRPGIIVSNDTSNRYSEFVEVVYTTTQQKPPIPTHVNITSLKKPCVALCEQVHPLSKKKIINRSGRCSDSEMDKIDKALKINFGLTDSAECESTSMCDYKTLYDDIIDRIFALIERKDKENER